MTERLLKPIDASLAWLWGRNVANVVVNRPIFIVGVERSGTTLLYSLLANHPDLYWFSRLDSLWPDVPCITTLIRRAVSKVSKNEVYIAIPKTISRSTGLLPPSECIPFWKGVFGFGDEENYIVEDDRLTEDSVNEHLIKHLYQDFQKRLYWSGKRRLLFKHPGFSLRLRFLHALFKDALFIHMVRNPFANLKSLVKAKEASNERFWGIKIPGWRYLINTDLELQAAIQIRRTMEIIEEDVSKTQLHRQYLQIRYEDLLRMPEKTLSEALEFCDLDWKESLEKAMRSIRKEPPGESFKEGLPKEIIQILAPIAERYGYN